MTKPTIRELLEAVIERHFEDYPNGTCERCKVELPCPERDLAERVEAVLRLHTEYLDGRFEPYCRTCGETESCPCPTVRALDGEEA